MNKTVYLINKSFVLREIGPVHIVVNTRGNNLYELNDTAVEIYKYLQQSLAIEDIVKLLSSKYELNEQTILSDIMNLVNSFLQIGIVSSKQLNNDVGQSHKVLIPTKPFVYYQTSIWGKKNFPYKVKSFELTPKCNFGCYHCYQGDLRQSGRCLQTREIKLIINKMVEIGVLEVVFAGGEPLSRPDFKEIYTYAKKRGMLVRIFTNGSLIDESVLSLFLKLPPEKLIVSITI